MDALPSTHEVAHGRRDSGAGAAAMTQPTRRGDGARAASSNRWTPAKGDVVQLWNVQARAWFDGVVRHPGGPGIVLVAGRSDSNVTYL